MKKSIFKVGFLTTLILILTVSCTSPSEETTAKVPAVSNKQKVANSSALPSVSDVYDLPEYIGALHNAGIYAFVEYVNENNLSPYTESEFTHEMIETFAQNYVVEHLGEFEYIYDFDIELNANTMTAYGELLDSILSLDVEIADINNYIEDATNEFYAEYVIDSPNDIVYEIVKEIAKATNILWGEEWDFEQQSFILPYSIFAGRRSANDDNNNQESEQNKKEKQDRLTKADVAGAEEGAKMGTSIGSSVGFYGAVVGCAIGTAVGAIVYSVEEFVKQDSEATALRLEADQIIPNTYLYNYLRYLQAVHPEKYYSLYGNKFDNIF